MYRPHLLILLVIISCMLLLSRDRDISVIAETNTLNQSDSLNYSDLLVSNNKIFTLGFFTSSSSTNSTYLAIWYTLSPYLNSDSDYLSRLWIANRANPIISDDFPTLIIDDRTGKLVINRTLEDPIHLCPEAAPTTTRSGSRKSRAVLQDDGNLVLREVNSDGSDGRNLWQSFDCPTNTLLPGMKLGVNHRTRRNWSLTSWLAKDDPSPGPFSLQWDPMLLQLVIRRRRVVFWTSGALKNGIFQVEHKSRIFNSSLLQGYHVISSKTSDEEYFSYSEEKAPATEDIYTNIGMLLRIDHLGRLYDSEGTFIGLDNLCYGYNTNNDNGCAEWTQPQCRLYNTRFELRNGAFVNLLQSDNDTGGYYYNESIGPVDCRIRCWNDCDCQAYEFREEMGCSTFSNKFKFDPDPIIGSSLKCYYVIQRPQTKLMNAKKWIAISLSITVVLLVSVIVIIFCWRWNREGRKEDHLHQLMTETNMFDNANELGSYNDFDQNLKIFNFSSIVEATSNFSAQNKLGEGGFGPVYKGKLPEGIEVAVKRLSRCSRQGLAEFKNELILIAKLQHMNLVRLLGCCIQANEKMLIYEYMPNKSLDSFLFDASKSGVLDWRRRVKIIEGISQGLLYLHQYSRLRIIHRDLKASNILLDADLNPKISDFGMAKIFKSNDLIANTNRIVGTYGYMSPEYAMEGIFSMKSDVFSFGIILLEILSGKRINSFYNIHKPMNLVRYAWDLWQKEEGLELMDPTLSDSCSTQQFLRFIQVGLLCVEESPEDRPTISEVISMITNEDIHIHVVKKPAFTDTASNVNPQRNDHFECHSIYNVSMSTVNGR